MDNSKTVRMNDTVLLYIGAGLASDIEYFIAKAPYRLVLIEPNPDLAEYLEAQCTQYSFFRFLPYAIWPDPSETCFQVFNHFEMSSLNPSDHLFEFFPGIHLEKTVVVHTIDPRDLIGRYYQPERTISVIIDVPGANTEILEAIIASEYLPALGEIYIKPDNPALFPDSKKLKTLLDMLNNCGFQSCTHDHTEFEKFTYDPIRAELIKTQRLTKEIQDAKDTLTVQNKDLQQKLEEALETQKVLEAQKVDAEREKERREKKAQDAEDALLAKNKDLQQKLREVLEDQKADAEREKETLESERDTLQRRVDMLLRLQSISQSNLLDLQKKYAELQISNTQTEELLQALYSKLSDARHHLSDLSKEDANKVGE